ncbi:threonine ammonia-lyase, biosynthetic [uncultured Enterovirga sp.]|uniref:threonine ammonia-lyase, biosynthetic n=1 Tax=uncultured Enterovirga sp. TaxID=2026352 RepID=UPI0035CBD418
MQETVRKILTARVYDVAIESPLDPMPRLSARLGASVLLKREDLQPVFSFKIRGAYNKIAGLPPEALARGVICASAGNHAQGVALAAARRGVKATIVMPTTTPAIKVEAVRARGGHVVLHGDAFDEANAEARRLERESGATFIHPFDDPEVIAGQGTVGLEILRQHSEPIEAIFVPVGGGGLAAGIAAIVRFLRPETKVIGVEPAEAASMQAALAAGERVVLNQVGLFADGVAVRQVGAETFRLCRDLLDPEVVTVDTDAICAAVKDVFDDTRAISEPAGAVAVAGLKLYAARHPVRTGALVAINSGANLNFDRLRHIAERAEVGEGREALLAVTIPERPGSYRRFIQLLGNRSVTEFNYRYAEPRGEGAPRDAHIFVGVALKHPDEKAQILQALAGADYPVVDMSDNEMAKLHARYMVGGRAGDLRDEIVCRFQFPERPGALLRFLESLRPEWNITLFHYRNHGADYGRVLAGIQVPEPERAAFREALQALGYPYADETENPAYRLFLDASA